MLVSAISPGLPNHVKNLGNYGCYSGRWKKLRMGESFGKLNG
jgi:hypothetical protein